MRSEKHWSSRTTTAAVLVAVLINGLMLIAGTGFLRNRPVSNTGAVDADTLWGAMLLGSAPIIWGIQQVKFGRDDNGFRPHGLPSLLMRQPVM